MASKLTVQTTHRATALIAVSNRHRYSWSDPREAQKRGLTSTAPTSQIMAQQKHGSTLENIVGYFERSDFDYLSLEYGGNSIRLSRRPLEQASASQDAPASANESSEHTLVRAPSVGTIEMPEGCERFPAAGEHISVGEVLFSIRRYRSVVPVHAAASGSLASVGVTLGEFVEFGQPLATYAK